MCKARKELGIDQGTKAKRRYQRSCRASKEGGRGELPKDDRGRQVSGETKESQRREISGTEAKEQQNRDQRDQPNKEERVQGDHSGVATSARTKGSEGTDTEERVQGITKGAASARTKGIEGDRHRRAGPRDQASKAKSKGRTDQDRRLLKHYQRPIQGAKV